MNENNLNYYSRKSPVKRRKNLPPGTLLNYDYKLSTPPATSRVKRSERPEHLRDKAESYSCPNRSFIDNQILIIDDDCFNVPSEDILIVDDDEDIMIDVSQPIEEREEEEEDEYYEKQRYQEQKSVTDDLNSAKLKEKDQKQIKQIKLANDKIIEQKGEKQNKGKEKDLSRIFSFGNEREVETYRQKVFEQTENAHGPKEPLVRRLFSSDMFERREMNEEKNKIKQNYSRASTSRIQKEKEKVFQQKRCFEKKNENSQMEDWQKMIVKFIHKRSENLQIQDYLKKEQASLKVQMIKDSSEENQKENNDESIQEKNSEKQSQILISSEVKKNENQNETQISHKTFIPQKTMKENSEEIPYFKTTQSLHRQQQVKKAEGNIVKNVQEEPAREIVYTSGNKLIKTLEHPFQRYMISIDHPELNLQPYENSLQLLQPVLHKLPESLLPTYLNLYRTLMEKKMKLTQKMTHQDNTIFLIKLMTELHKRFIKFDDYVLEQSKKNQKQNVIRINHEIILALVRMLSRNL